MCTLNFSYNSLNYIYHQNKYDIHIFDSARDCRRYMNLWLIRFYKPLIIIYVFNLKRQYEERISEDFIDQVIDQKENPYIYLVGTRLDDFDGDLNYYRKQAQDLINKGKIKKYFEVSSKTGEGINFLVKNIKIDNAMILNGTNFSFNYLESLREYMKIDNKKLIKNKLNKLKKYIYL